MFPWESAFSGAETCPTWAPEGMYENHISGVCIMLYFYMLVSNTSVKYALCCAFGLLKGCMRIALVGYELCCAFGLLMRTSLVEYALCCTFVCWWVTP